MLDEENPRPSRIVFQDKEGEEQGPSAQGTSVDHGNDPTDDASDPRSRGRSSCGSPYLSPPEEDTGSAKEGEGESAEASRGTCQHHRVIRPLLTPTTSPKSRPQGYSADECRHPHRCFKRARRRIQLSQRRPGGHLRCLY